MHLHPDANMKSEERNWKRGKQEEKCKRRGGAVVTRLSWKKWNRLNTGIKTQSPFRVTGKSGADRNFGEETNRRGNRGRYVNTGNHASSLKISDQIRHKVLGAHANEAFFFFLKRLVLHTVRFILFFCDQGTVSKINQSINQSSFCRRTYSLLAPPRCLKADDIV